MVKLKVKEEQTVKQEEDLRKQKDKLDEENKLMKRKNFTEVEEEGMQERKRGVGREEVYECTIKMVSTWEKLDEENKWNRKS